MPKKPFSKAGSTNTAGRRAGTAGDQSRQEKRISGNPFPRIGYLGLRPVRIALSLAAVAILQLSMTRDKLALPFLDTQLHYNFDNALFTTYARNGNRLGNLRSQFGITTVSYTRWGEPSGQTGYYTHHPFLLKSVFQQYSKLFGDSEWVSRSFYLLLSFGIAAGFHTVILMVTGSLGVAFCGTAILVNIPIFAIFQTCVKYEIDGMLVGIWHFAAVIAFLVSRHRTLLLIIVLLSAMAPLTSWPAVLLAFPTMLWLSAERVFAKSRKAGLAAASASAGMAFGGLTLLVFFIWMKGSWVNFKADILSAYGSRTDTSEIASSTWMERQAAFAEINFGKALWFQGPLFEYYTDRPVVVLNSEDNPKPGDKILLLRYTQQAQILPKLEEHFGIRLSNEKCNSRLCAYDAKPYREQNQSQGTAQCRSHHAGWSTQNRGIHGSSLEVTMRRSLSLALSPARSSRPALVRLDTLPVWPYNLHQLYH